MCLESYLAPHGGLLAGGECVSMAKNVHAMLCAGQHDIDTVGCLQEPDHAFPTKPQLAMTHCMYSRLMIHAQLHELLMVQHCWTQQIVSCIVHCVALRESIISMQADMQAGDLSLLVVADQGQDDDCRLLSLEVVHCCNSDTVIQVDSADVSCKPQLATGRSLYRCCALLLFAALLTEGLSELQHWCSIDYRAYLQQ